MPETCHFALEFSGDKFDKPHEQTGNVCVFASTERLRTVVIAKERKHIPTLDGVRALSILIVIASHAVDRFEFPGIMRMGPIGVLIFFALSGYLITSNLLDEHCMTGLISLRNFYVRRAFRILPPALLFLGVVWLLSLNGAVICSSDALRAALFFYASYFDFDVTGWRVSHFWSLSVEEHFYLIWPFLLLVFGARNGWKIAGLSALAVCIWRVVDDHFGIIGGMFGAFLTADEHRTDLIADALFWGCCLAYALRRPVIMSRLASTLCAILTFGLMIFLVVKQINHATPLLHVLPTLFLASVVAVPNAPIGRFLELQPMRIVGNISYSLYIWQQLFLGGSGPRLSTPLAFAAIFLCAFGSRFLIEKPFIRMGKSLLFSQHLPKDGKVA